MYVNFCMDAALKTTEWWNLTSNFSVSKNCNSYSKQ